MGNDLLVGEWQLDSSGDRFFAYDEIFLLPGGTCYMFSRADGGSLVEKGRFFAKYSIAVVLNDTVILKIIDSNRLVTHLQKVNNSEQFYHRVTYGDFNENLAVCLKADSLRRKIIGWWKLEVGGNPIKLMNYNGYYNRFTLNIRDDGKAVFYLENRYDSSVDYSYTAQPGSLLLQRGCLVSSCYISVEPKGKMNLVLDERLGDTLQLRRLADIK